MSEPDLLQRQREILRTFRQTTATRVQVETDAEARHKTEREAVDVSLNKVQQETETQRTKAEADAEARRKAEQQSAVAALNQVRQIATAELAEARQAQETTKAALAQAGLQRLLKQTRPSPTTPRPVANPAQELTRSVSVSTNASKRIQLSVEALQRLQKAAASRRGLLAALAVIAILFLAAAGVLGYQEWRIKRTYRAAVAALDAGEWEKARAELQQLISLDSNYEDAQTLLRESYYRSAVAAIEAGDWNKAATEFLELANLEPNYKDLQQLLQIQSLWVEDFQVFDSDKYDVQDAAYWDKDNGYFVLTEPRRSQKGAIFPKIVVEMNNWVVEFDFRIGGGSGADGIFFEFLETSSSALKGYVVEFDTYFGSDNIGDPQGQHIAVRKADSTEHLASYIVTSDSRGGLKDNQWHHARIALSDGTLTVCYDGDGRITNYSIPDYKPFSGVFGFVGRTGGSDDWHIVDNIRITLAPSSIISSISCRDALK